MALLRGKALAPMAGQEAKKKKESSLNFDYLMFFSISYVSSIILVTTFFCCFDQNFICLLFFLLKYRQYFVFFSIKISHLIILFLSKHRLSFVFPMKMTLNKCRAGYEVRGALGGEGRRVKWDEVSRV